MKMIGVALCLACLILLPACGQQNPAGSNRTGASLENAPFAKGPRLEAPFAIDGAAYDLVYDPYRERVYASLNGNGPGLLVRINLGTGKIDGELRLPGEVGPLALSPDGSRLWVGIYNAGIPNKTDDFAGLCRVDPETMKAGEPTPLNPRSPSRPIPMSLAMLPGTKDTVVASLGCIDKPTAGVYDAGVARPETVDGPVCSGIVYSGEGNTFFAFNNKSTGWELQELLVTDAGIRHVKSYPGVVRNFESTLAAGGGRIFPSIGKVFDVKARQPLGEVPGGEAIAIDVSNRRIYQVNNQQMPGTTVSALDLDSLRPAATYLVPHDLRKFEPGKLAPAGGNADGVFRRATCKPALMLGETVLVVNQWNVLKFLPAAEILKGALKKADPT